jgi:hypothetical protein
MEVSGQPQMPTSLHLEKDLVASIDEEAGWALEPVWTFWRREKSFDPTEI